jgi:hypothetical protein
MVAWKFLARLKDRKGLGLRFIMAKKKKTRQCYSNGYGGTIIMFQ